MFDEKWYIECDLEVAMQRVCKRHMQTGMTLLFYLRGQGQSKQEATFRIDYNDRPNGKLIETTKKYADLVITSIQENQ